MEKTLKLVCKEAMGKRNLRFAVAHANDLEKASWLSERIKREFEVQDIMIVNVSPALGTRRPGCGRVAFLGGS